MQNGWKVFQPINVEAFDLLAFKPEIGYRKIQVKTGNVHDGVIVSYTTRANGLGYKYYTSEEIDYLAIWVEELQKAYLIPVEDRLNENNVVKAILRLRIAPTKNNNSTGIEAVQYEL
jgi:hypothetical protein